jgi:hypothetical protein
MKDGKVTEIHRYPEAEDELEWYWGAADAAIGFKGIAYDSTGEGVFDDAASWSLHASKHDARHRAAVKQRARVEFVLRQLSVESHETLRRVFEPRGWAWIDDLAEVGVRNAFRRGKSQSNLIGLAVETLAVHRVWNEHAARSPRPVTPTPGAVDMLRILEWEASADSKALAVIKREANDRLTRALRAYEEGRVARNATEAAQKTETTKSWRERLTNRIMGR